MEEITVDALKKNIDVVIDFVDERIGKLNCPNKIKSQIDVAVDEIFSNIVNYAYDGKNGMATVKYDYDKEKKMVSIVFIDSGVMYNPLEKEDPDINMSLDDRQIGGLGIYIVKNTMDDMTYEYKNNNNILTIKKIIE